MITSTSTSNNSEIYIDIFWYKYFYKYINVIARILIKNIVISATRLFKFKFTQKRANQLIFVYNFIASMFLFVF